MKTDERTRYYSAFGSVAGALLALVPLLLVFDQTLLGNSEIGSRWFVVVALIAMVITILAAYAMLNFLRIERLREKLRRVFIIYSHNDIKVAKEIAELLRENGLEPWLDAENITAGQIWVEEVTNALTESAMAIVLLSKNSTQSGFASAELKLAIQSLESNDKTSSPLIPIKLDETEIPSSIAHIQYVDYKRPDAKEFLVKSLAVAMDRIMGKPSLISRYSIKIVKSFFLETFFLCSYRNPEQTPSASISNQLILSPLQYPLLVGSISLKTTSSKSLASIMS